MDTQHTHPQGADGELENKIAEAIGFQKYDGPENILVVRASNGIEKWRTKDTILNNLEKLVYSELDNLLKQLYDQRVLNTGNEDYVPLRVINKVIQNLHGSRHD